MKYNTFSFLINKISKILLLLLIIISILSATSCSLLESKYKNRRYNNIILSKEACNTEVKRLLRVDEIYYFDCNFSNMADIEILDSSFNISIQGSFLADSNDEQFLDLSKQAQVFIVANYKIRSNGNCLGFSIVSSVLTPSSSEKQNEIYDNTTFISFSELKGDNGNGTIYGNNNTIYEITVPNGFYSVDLANALNPISYYRKYSGTLYDIKVMHIPLWVVTHYENYDSFNNDESFATMEKIKSHLNKNAKYTKK